LFPIGGAFFYFILNIITLGFYGVYWCVKAEKFLSKMYETRGMTYRKTHAWQWYLFGSFIVVGPFIAFYALKDRKIELFKNDASIYPTHKNSSFIGMIIKLAVFITLILILWPTIWEVVKLIMVDDLTTAEALYSPEELYDYVGQNYKFEPTKWKIYEIVVVANIVVNDRLYKYTDGVYLDLRKDTGEMANRLVMQNMSDKAMTCVGYSVVLGIFLERIEGYSCYLITCEGHCWLLVADEEKGEYAMFDSTGYLNDSETNILVNFDNPKFKKTPIIPALIPVESTGETAQYIFNKYKNVYTQFQELIN
jgi:hypothetical protein